MKILILILLNLLIELLLIQNYEFILATLLLHIYIKTHI